MDHRGCPVAGSGGGENRIPPGGPCDPKGGSLLRFTPTSGCLPSGPFDMSGSSWVLLGLMRRGVGDQASGIVHAMLRLRRV